VAILRGEEWPRIFRTISRNSSALFHSRTLQPKKILAELECIQSKIIHTSLSPEQEKTSGDPGGINCLNRWHRPRRAENREKEKILPMRPRPFAFPL
jgi:hypothetical protein